MLSSPHQTQVPHISPGVHPRAPLRSTASGALWALPGAHLPPLGTRAAPTPSFRHFLAMIPSLSPHSPQIRVLSLSPRSPQMEGPVTVPTLPSDQGPVTVPILPSDQGPGTVPTLPSDQGPVTVPTLPSDQGPVTVPTLPSDQAPVTVPTLPSDAGILTGSTHLPGERRCLHTSWPWELAALPVTVPPPRRSLSR